MQCVKVGLLIAHLIAAVEEQHELHVGLSVHFPVPALEVVGVAGKTIDEEAELLAVLCHCFFHGLTKQTVDQPERKKTHRVQATFQKSNSIVAKISVRKVTID